MNPEETYPSNTEKKRTSSLRNIRRLKIIGVGLTTIGIALFGYFVYTVGLEEILVGIYRIGIGGFAAILLIYCLRMCVRATAWRLSTYEPYKLTFGDTFPAVIIGEALSSIVPLGILVSGTAKALAVRKRVPLVVGLSSVATENLFFSLITGLFISFGALAFLARFELPEVWIYIINSLIGLIAFVTIFGLLMVIRQWHWASYILEFVHERVFFRNILGDLRIQVRLFENLIYAFYRKHPGRFLPICLLQVAFHLLGIFEVWFILTKITGSLPTVATAFFLESISRLITVVFKLIPLRVGVEEAGAEFIVETMAVGVGIGVTLAIIRKGSGLFWAAAGMILIVKRGFSFKQIKEVIRESREIRG